ncbi:tripartite tricarboxylate transporter substrate-binding protein [Sphaerisporangium sp. TRM90804]|uniref:tripartite tricarboxylate transporter substrate-binding protein n=1 Tax=Sphaerisporangium sp. TRM90804 TaxID=3031113 RepID=UPI00244D0C3F|nr:tripartite tricarboxylate transporter substrate-binding protein [Sphaerisporangium sp. TRM90804]MDH2427132.1 tripartite tricarboxylate transporter substrate-binding protein [Sphaerisporangium sp. TRM90804]
MRRRRVLALGAGLAALAAGCGDASPARRLASRTLSVVVPGPVGGEADRVARSFTAIAERGGLTRRVEVVNRPARLALVEYVRAGPGHLLMAEPEMVGTVRPTRQATAFAGATPLARLCGEWELLVVPASSRIQAFGAFADQMRGAPDRLVVAGGGEGGMDHLLLGMLAQSLGVDPRALRYLACRTGGEAVDAMAAGRAEAVLGSQSGLRERVRAGDLRVLAVSSPERIPGLDAPTLLECDVHLYCANWRALLGPGDLSGEDRSALTALCNQVTESPPWERLCRRNGWTSLYLDGEEFRQWLRVESARLSRAYGDLGLPA